MSKPEVYPAGMSAERFKALTSPFELSRFGKKFPMPAFYTTEALMKKLQDMEASGKVYEEPDAGMPDMFEPDDYAELKFRKLYPVQRDSTGQYRCYFCGHYKDLPNNPVAPISAGK